jgi:single-strand DNA-binding protein
VLNKAQIIGRLGQDPQTVSEGVVRLNVATTETWKDRESGERREKTEWHQVSLFGKLAEIATNYLHKGSLVYIEGSLETRRYDKDGVTHYSTSIKGRELRMLEKRGDGAEEGSGAGEGVRSNARAAGGQRGNGQRNSGPGSNGGSSGTRSAAQSSQPVEDDDFDLGTIPF